MDYTKERNNLIDTNDACKMSLKNKLGIDVFFKIGVEIEFYLIDKKSSKIDLENINTPLSKDFQNYLKYTKSNEVVIDFSLKLKKKLLEYEIEISDIENEDGKNQFEIQIHPINHPVLIADAIARFKKYANEIANDMNLYFIFCGKPFEEDAGNAMQINISILNQAGVNIFQHNDRFSVVINFAIGGLMQCMLEMIYLCCDDSNNSYFKYIKPKSGSLHINYPTNVSWGINNRTCAIRVPFSKSMNMQDSRIEFRPSTLCANPYNIICGILYAITFGICKEIKQPEQIYYNAFEDKYKDIPSFPKTQGDALRIYYGGRVNSIIDGEIYNQIKLALIEK